MTWKGSKLHRKLRKEIRSTYLEWILGGASLGIIGITVGLIPLAEQNELTEIDQHLILKRDTNSNATTLAPIPTMPDIGNFPPDAFTFPQLRQGAVVLHSIGMIYMFFALAIVCDEFFVPALEVITERLSLTEDIAGATFMAAGGSAPELFTSIFGLFVSGSSVGIGTIVGSAVFNILFVIGMCALVANGVLQLTWWPLFRDSSFYSLSLVVLIVCYYDWQIHIYEAVLLLLCYVAYVTFMYFNSTVEKKVKENLCKRTPDSSSDLTTVSSTNNLVLGKCEPELAAIRRMEPEQNGMSSRPSTAGLKFRAGLLQLMIQTIDPLAEGRMEERAMQLRAIATKHGKTGPDQNGNVDNNLDQAVQEDAVTPTKSQNGHTRSLHASDSHRSSLTAVESLEGESIQGVQLESQLSNDLSPNSHSSVNLSTSSASTTEVVIVNGNSAVAKRPDVERQAAWTPGADDGGDESEPLDISWPDSCRKRISYVLLAPIIFPLWLTLPDTRRSEKKKWYPITFIGSILWISIYSYLMLWFASVIGVTIGMPIEIMGLTVLAAGTSVPDLLTSVIVARKGFGDMAISSSIGSNLFDITIGLPLPWLIGTLMQVQNGGFISVNAQGLLCSILLLFGMLIITIASIAVFKWKLSKWLGATFIAMYFIFLAVSVLLALDKIPCIELGRSTP